MSQDPEKLATGVPNVEMFGVPAVRLEGMLDLGNHQMLTYDEVHSVAYTPPPMLFRPSP